MNEEKKVSMKDVFDFKFYVGEKVYNINSVKSNSVLRKNKKNYLVVKEALIYEDLLADIIDGKLDNGIAIVGKSFVRRTSGIDIDVKFESNRAKLEEFYIDGYCDNVSHMKMVFLLESVNNNEEDYSITFGDDK